MNSHFLALTCSDVLRIIFEKLSVQDLARASCVCRVWNSVASDEEIVARIFLAPWKLKEVIGKPLSRSFWRDNNIRKFAISHRILRGDTIVSLAVKYSVQVIDIKRMNNMMSDHGMYSRDRLLVPISNPDVLINATCYIEMDLYAKREVAVLYLESGLNEMANMLTNGTEKGKKKVFDYLRRSLQVDEGTAQYYLSISNGDLRAAFSKFSNDLDWERRVKLA